MLVVRGSCVRVVFFACLLCLGTQEKLYDDRQFFCKITGQLTNNLLFIQAGRFRPETFIPIRSELFARSSGVECVVLFKTREFDESNSQSHDYIFTVSMQPPKEIIVNSMTLRMELGTVWYSEFLTENDYTAVKKHPNLLWIIKRAYTPFSRGGTGIRFARLSFTSEGNTGEIGINVTITVPEVCGVGSFQCVPDCIPLSLVCNGRRNCLHGEDEADCRIKVINYVYPFLAFAAVVLVGTLVMRASAGLYQLSNS